MWREIFQLWVQAEIFESTRERDRGERQVEEVERRLEGFVREVDKRGLGDGRKGRLGKKGRDAWQRFLKLNVQLLDLKKVCETSSLFTMVTEHFTV